MTMPLERLLSVLAAGSRANCGAIPFVWRHAAIQHIFSKLLYNVKIGAKFDKIGL